MKYHKSFSLKDRVRFINRVFPTNIEQIIKYETLVENYNWVWLMNGTLRLSLFVVAIGGRLLSPC